MFLKIEGREFDVNIEPLREKMLAGLAGLVAGADGNATHSMLRQIVKQACNMAIGPLGIEKRDRNDDPIALVAGKIADIIFTHIQDGGLTLEGREILPFEPEPQAQEAPGELDSPTARREARDDADTGDGGRPVGDHRGDGERQDGSQP